MRIATLVPSSTEMLFALGLGDSVVGVTHECDYPPEAAEPHLTRSLIPMGLAPGRDRAAVRERTERGEAIYELDAEAFDELDPELIVTQAVCEVCAVSYDDVRAVAERCLAAARDLARPVDVGEVLADVPRSPRRRRRKKRARAWCEEAANRLDRVRGAVEGGAAPAGGGPRVARPGLRRRALGAADDRDCRRRGRARHARREVPHGRLGRGRRGGTGGRRRGAVRLRHRGSGERGGCVRRQTRGARAPSRRRRASAYFSRPGPRLVDGMELLAHVLHPDLATRRLLA